MLANVSPNIAILPVVNGQKAIASSEREETVFEAELAGVQCQVTDLTTCYDADSMLDSILRVAFRAPNGVLAVCDIVLGYGGSNLTYEFRCGQESKEAESWLVVPEAGDFSVLARSDSDDTEGGRLYQLNVNGRGKFWYFFLPRKDDTVSLGRHAASVGDQVFELTSIAVALENVSIGGMVPSSARFSIAAGDWFERLHLRSRGAWTFEVVHNGKVEDSVESQTFLSPSLMLPALCEGEGFSVLAKNEVVGDDKPEEYKYAIDWQALKPLYSEGAYISVRVENDCLRGRISALSDEVSVSPEALVIVLLVEGVAQCCVRPDRQGWFLFDIEPTWRSRVLKVQSKVLLQDGKSVRVSSDSVPLLSDPESLHRYPCVDVLKSSYKGRTVCVLGSGPSADVTARSQVDALVCVNGSMGVLPPGAGADVLVITDQTLIENSEVAEHSRESLAGRHVRTLVCITKKLILKEVTDLVAQCGLTYDEVIEMPNQERLNLSGRPFGRVIPPSPGNALACSAGVTAILLMYYAGVAKFSISGFDFDGGHYFSKDTRRAHSGMDRAVIDYLKRSPGLLSIDGGKYE